VLLSRPVTPGAPTAEKSLPATFAAVIAISASARRARSRASSSSPWSSNMNAWIALMEISAMVWSQVNHVTINRFEIGQEASNPSTLVAIRTALVSAGVEFIRRTAAGPE
jgi:hypothetical protein